MSNLLQLACPKCSTLLKLKRPATATAAAKCGSCSHTFTFRVPAAAPAAPRAPAPRAPAPQQPIATQAPSAAAIPSTQAANDPFADPFADMGNIPPPSQAGAAGTSNRTTAPKNRAPKKRVRKNEGQQRGVGLKVIGASAAVLLLVGVTWLILSQASLVSSPLALFDSPKSVLEDTDALDLEIQQLVNSLEGGTVTPENMDKLHGFLRESAELMSRAAKLSLMTEQEAVELTGIETEAPKKTTGFFRSRKPVPEGPLDDDAMLAIGEKLAEIPREERLEFQHGASEALGTNTIIRKYIRYGHLESPEPTTRAEEIAVEQISLTRQATILGLPVLAKLRKTRPDSTETPEQLKSRIYAAYQNIEDDLSDLAEEMFVLAEESYELSKTKKQSTEQYDEVRREAAAMLFVVYRQSLGRENGKIETFDSLNSFFKASSDVDSAQRGFIPSRVAAEIKRNEPTPEEIAQRRAEMKQRMADQKAMQEKAADDENRKIMALAAAEAAEAEKAAEEKQAADKAAADKAAAARAAEMANKVAGNSSANTAANTAANQNSNSGANQTGRSGSRFGGGRSNIGGGRGASSQQGNGRAGSRFGGIGRSSAPSFDPKTGVTILMKNGKGISTREISAVFSKTLKGSSQVSSRNGELTIKLSYTGSLEDVAKLIDFGKVVTIDAASRQIIVEPK